MPKRIVDGEALWLSDKVKSLPEKYRMHYANWLPMAEANGTFEASPSRVYAKIYSYLLPSFTKKRVQSVLDAFVRAGLVYLWEEQGKSWGYFVGIEKSGRLPDYRHLDRYKNLPPTCPNREKRGIEAGVIPE